MKSSSKEKTVSIENIMKDIKSTAAAMSDNYAPASYETGPVNLQRVTDLQTEARGYIHTLITTKDNTAVRNVVPSGRGIAGKFEVFVKRFIRKMTVWLVEPPWQQQKRLNNALTSLLARSIEINEELLRGVSHLTRELDEIKNKK